MSVVKTRAPAKSSRTQVYGRNVIVSGIRLVVIAGSGLLLPAYLTHHLAPTSYSAWVLVVQVAGYVGYLEFGVTTAIAKYIAEHVAANDERACNEHASAGVAITCISGIAGIILSGILAASVSLLFHDMPPVLLHDVSIGVFLVGASLAILLTAAAFAGIFMGLQRFAVPMTLITVNKLLYVVVVLVAVSRHASLTQMGGAVAAVNVLTAAAIAVAWRILIPEINVRRNLVVRATVHKMLGYCAVLGVWTSGMLLISGLDTTIVGHFDFSETAYYAVAATPSSFLTLALQAVLGPLMPAVSAASVDRTPEEMGELLVRSSRRSFLLSQVSGLPFLMFSSWILSVWVGDTYAAHGFVLLRILVAANIVRNFFGPYATMVIATGLQKYATLSGVCEAIVNICFSVLLGKYYGALGVAYGTLIGSFVGVAVHFGVSLRMTKTAFVIAPLKLLSSGMARPGIATIPTLVLLPFYWRTLNPHRDLAVLLGWSLTTIFLGWRFGLLQFERSRIVCALGGFRQIRAQIGLRIAREMRGRARG